MKTVIALVITITILVLVLLLLLKILKSERERNKKLLLDIESQKKNIVALYKHAEEIADIEKNRRKRESELKEAKTDEEIISIINTIININNDRVCNNSQK